MSSKSELAKSFDSKTMAVVAHKGYNVEKKLGQGAFGTVFKATNRKTGQLAAVKVISLNEMSESSRKKFLPREIQAQIDSKHENLIEVFDIFRANKRLYIFMEFAANGDITGYSRKHNGIPEKLACQWFLQVSNGLAYMHLQLNTAHRDIKTDNMLLDSRYVAKLSDFGFAKVLVERGQVIMSQTFCGTLPYEAPQILEHRPYNGFKADIWSMGVTFFIMFYDRFPFPYKEGKPAMLKYMSDYPRYIRGRYAKRLPEEANRLVEAMLNPDEGRRCSVNDLTRNSWLMRNCS